MIRHNTRQINIKENPIFIVGEMPGTPSKVQNEFIVWTGNKSAYLINEAINGYDNIYLTNISNYYTKSAKTELFWATGIKELEEDIKKYNPFKIIALGQFAYKKLLSIYLDIPIFLIEHPSYIRRFNKDKDEYIEKIRRLLR